MEATGEMCGKMSVGLKMGRERRQRMLGVMATAALLIVEGHDE